MGGSVGKSKNNSSSSYTQGLPQEQLDAYQKLWNSGFSQLANGNGFMSQIGGSAQASQDMIDKLFKSGTSALDKLNAGGAYGDSSAIRDQLMNSMGGRSNTGQMYENIVGGAGNTYIDPMIDKMRSDSAQNLQTMRNSNALDASMVGQNGSSRQAMEDAMLGAQANRDLSSQEATARANAYDKDLNWKMGIAGMADSNKQSEQDRLLSMLQGNQQSINDAGNLSNSLSGLASGNMSPWLQAQQSQWGPLMNMAALIGNPIMTGSGKSGSSGKGMGLSGGLF